MFTLLKVVGERARSPTTFVMITNQKCQLYHIFPTWKILSFLFIPLADFEFSYFTQSIDSQGAISTFSS